MIFAWNDQFPDGYVSEDNVHEPSPWGPSPDGLIMIHSFEVVFFPIAHIPILIFGASVQFSTPMFRNIICISFFFNPV